MSEAADNVAQAAVDLLRRLEWSGVSRGPGSGAMGSGGDGRAYSSCPICRQVRERNLDFVPEAVGHTPDCQMNRVLNAVGRV